MGVIYSGTTSPPHLFSTSSRRSRFAFWLRARLFSTFPIGNSFFFKSVPKFVMMSARVFIDGNDKYKLRVAELGAINHFQWETIRNMGFFNALRWKRTNSLRFWRRRSQFTLGLFKIATVIVGKRRVTWKFTTSSNGT